MLAFRLLPLRLTLIVPVLVIAGLLMLVILWQLLFTVQPAARQAATYATANHMADLLLHTAAEQARERGLTVALLGRPTSTADDDLALRDTLRQLRADSNAALQSALELGEALAAGQGADGLLGDGLAKVRAAWLQVDEARRRVDQTRDGTPAIQAAEWLATMTALIDSAARLRDLPFLPDGALQEAAFKNTQLKQAIWLASEYAGRERALLALAIGQGVPLPDATRQELLGYRSIVERQLHYLREVGLPLLGGQDDSEVHQAWEQLQTAFVERFGAARERVYAGAERGDYGLDARQWLAAATAGIDSLLAFSRAISHSAALDIERAGAQSRRSQWISLLLLSGTLGLTIALFLLVRLVARRLCRAAQLIQQAERDNDLGIRLDARGRDELARLASAYNAMLARFDELIQAAREAAREADRDAGQAATAALQTERGVEQQRTALTELVSAMSQMVAVVQEVATNTAETAQAAHDSHGEAAGGRTLAAQMAEDIDRLAGEIGSAARIIARLQGDSDAIGGVLDVINGIADQTNLLALNAAIEAARAGEQGRGFAVVAGEVRDLAMRASSSTGEIRSMIQHLQEQARQAVGGMTAAQREAGRSVERTQQASAALERIAAAVSTISQMTRQIATAAEEQAAVTAQMQLNIDSIAEAAEQNTRAARQTVGAARDISDRMAHLLQLIGRFRLGGA